MAESKRTRVAGESITFLMIAIGILVALNVLGVFGVFARSDVTNAELFSLSAGSRDVAARLTDEMEIVGYFTEDMPEPSVERYVRDILTEYEQAAGGNIRLSYVVPDEEDEQEAAERDGLTRQRMQAFEDDGFTYKEGYRGIVLKYLGETKAIDVSVDTTGLEYTITMTIKDLIGDTKKIGIVSGHEGPTLAEGLGNLRTWLPTYELSEVDANEAVDADEYAAVLLIAPENTVTEAELRNLNDYVMNGGNLGVFGGGFKVSIEGQPSGSQVDTGVNALLGQWGVRIKQNLVLDRQCMPVPAPGPIPGLRIQMPYFAMPMVSFDERQREDPPYIAYRLPSAVVPFASEIELTGALDSDTSVQRTVIARSSEYSWLAAEETLPLQPRNLGEWPMPEETGPFALVVALEGALPNAFRGGEGEGEGESAAPSEAPDRAPEDTRVLVAGTGIVLSDAFLPPNEEGTNASRNSAQSFVLNAVDWLGQDADLIAVRAKTVEDPALEVPQGVREAEQAARDAENQARAAASEGDEAGTEEAIDRRNEAVERLQAEADAWDDKKAVYRWSNTLGIPLLFAIFGVLRWRMRVAQKKDIAKRLEG